jgi:hypothetical protein
MGIRTEVGLTGPASDTQRFMAGRMGAHARTRPVDHMPLVTAPEDVVGVILDAVRDVATTAQPAGGT